MSTDQHEFKALTVDISGWPNRNLWPLSSGELAVRPGLSSLLSSGSGFFVGGGSIQNQRTDEAFHYLVTVDSNYRSPTLTVYDENFTIVQTTALGVGKKPRAVCVVQVVDQVCITSPDFPTYWGLVGSGVIRMTQGVSEIEGRTLIDPPQGISVSWGDRLVVAGNNAVYFSDPTLPRVFDPANVVDPPGGAIYGMHVSDSGSLILCTTNGVYSLSIDAAASGYIVLGVWQKVTDFATHSFQTTCLSRGTLYGLSARGYRRLASEGSQETLLNDPRFGLVPYIVGNARGQAHFPDYRKGVMVGTDQGPAVSIQGMFHRTDIESGLKSWWVDTNVSHDLTCTLRESDGTELLVTATNVYRLGFTGDDGIASHVRGGFFGQVNFPPEINPHLRWVDWATDASSFTLSVDNDLGASHDVSQAPPVIDTDEWETSHWSEAKMNTKRVDVDIRSNSVTLGLIVNVPGRKVDTTVNLWYKGPGRFRRQ